MENVKIEISAEIFVTWMPCPSIGPKWFWTVQIVLHGYKLFWSGPNCFGCVQIILVGFKLDFYGQIFIIWTFPNWFGPDQNELDPTKWLVLDQNDLDSPKSFWTHRTRHKLYVLYDEDLNEWSKWPWFFFGKSVEDYSNILLAIKISYN